jgi:transcriptional antiterminator RfaH
VQDSYEEEWLLCQTQPRHEFVAADHLIRQNYRCFIPHVMATVRHARRVYEKQRPLFPGYVFLSSLDGSYRMRSINGTRGVSRLVSFRDDGPAIVPSAIINELLASCNAQGLLTDPPSIEIGDHVNAISGPFTGIVARVIGLPDNFRVQVLLEILGQHVRTTLPRASVLKIEKALVGKCL